MEIKKTAALNLDPWTDLKQHTSARIALGRAGGSLSSKAWLDFKLAHAQARDAVHCAFDSVSLSKQLQSLSDKVLIVESQAVDRRQYLQRPDLGKRLNASSIALLGAEKKDSDLVLIVSDGLSATAVHAHVENLLGLLVPQLSHASWSLLPIVIARFGRVALEDEIGALMGAKIALILIGERPGLSSPDSLGAYLVYQPQLGNTDAMRNCVSNIRPQGLGYEAASATIFYLLQQARQRELSGIDLKDNRCLVDLENKQSLATLAKKT